MANVHDVVDAIAERTKPETAASWDPVGIQLGDAKTAVNSVGVCHEVTEAVVGHLEGDPVDLLVTYHPLLFEPTNRVQAGRSAEARAYRLIRAGVNLAVTHTDFDAAPGGAADSLAAVFQLRDIEPFGGDPDRGIPHIGRVGEFDATLAALDAQASDAFGRTGLRITGEPETHIHRLAVVPGSGGSFIEAAAHVAQALVTGDVSHHRLVRAADLGLAVVDPGHTETERPGMKALVELVRDCFDGEVEDLTSFDPKTWG